MTEDEALSNLEFCVRTNKYPQKYSDGTTRFLTDLEHLHIDADQVLTDFLTALGYTKLVSRYNELSERFYYV